MLQVRNVSVRFGAVMALTDVSLTFQPGEVHAVLGENGAGKSTLMSVLAGFITPVTGELSLNGSTHSFGHPSQMRNLGVQMVHQHFMLVPNFSVRENLALSALTNTSGLINTPELCAQAHQVEKSLGWQLDGKARTGSLSVGAQQRIEIVKALAGNAKVLILDEPTAVLTPSESRDLLGVLRGHALKGNIVIFIAHKLSEVIDVADRISVLRKGVLQGTGPKLDLNESQIIEWMLGSVEQFEKDDPTERGEVVLTAKNLRILGDEGEPRVNGVDFEVRKGEIFGVGGVDGNGQHELAEAIAGVGPVMSGHLEAKGKIGYLPQDRQRDGLVLEMSVEENLILGELPRAAKKGRFLSVRRLRDHASQLISDYQVKVHSPDQPVRFLSGGNQQKLVVARVMSHEPDILIAFNPTRGLDIRATQYVHQVLQKAAASGAAILLISTDQEEIDLLAHRAVYMTRGSFVNSFVEAAT